MLEFSLDMLESGTLGYGFIFIDLGMFLLVCCCSVVSEAGNAQWLKDTHRNSKLGEIMRILIILSVMLFATSALAVPVDPDAPSGIAATLNNGDALLVDGRVVMWDFISGWWRDLPEYDVPVPVDQIKDWAMMLVVTNTGDIWGRDNQEGWIQVELPYTPISNITESLGEVKSLFR